MAHVREFIQHAMACLGTSEATTRAATGNILHLIQQRVHAPQSQQLLTRLAGANHLLVEISHTHSHIVERERTLGALMCKAAAEVGGSVGPILNIMGRLRQSGLDISKAAAFMSLFLHFAQKHLEAELVDGLLDQCPELKHFIDQPPTGKEEEVS